MPLRRLFSPNQRTTAPPAMLKVLAASLLAALVCGEWVHAEQTRTVDETILASRIVDQDVYDNDQRLIGEVDDLIVRRSGRVKKLTVEFGGFLDLGDKLVALPFGSFSVREGRLSVDATEAQLEQKQPFDYYEEKLRPDYYYRRTPYAAYAVRNPRPDHYYEKGPYRMDLKDTPPMFHVPPHLLPNWSYSPSRFLVSSILDRRLVNRAGEEIGRLRDLVIDRGNRKVTKIILASRDILGKTVHVALDYQPLGFRHDGIIYDLAPVDLKEYLYPYEE